MFHRMQIWYDSYINGKEASTLPKPILARLSALLLCLLCLAAPALAEEKPFDAVLYFKENSGLDLSAHQGKVILLNFFTEWCPYCMQEMPDIKAVSELYDESAFQVVLVHPWDGEDASNTESVKETYGMQDMLFYEDEDFRVCQLTGLQGYPATLILDTMGTPAMGANYKVSLEMLTQQLDAMGVPRKADAP